MKPEMKPPFVVRIPQLVVVLCILLAAGTADARRRKKGGDKKDAPKVEKKDDSKKEEKAEKPDKKDEPKGKDPKPPVLDFTGLNFEGQLHTPQLLYFLDRASDELERASLERRSFIPEMVKSVDEDDL